MKKLILEPIPDFLSKLEDLKKEYPDYEIFQSVSDSDYLIFRLIVGFSKFYDTYNKPFYVNIYQDTRVHYSQIPTLL